MNFCNGHLHTQALFNDYCYCCCCCYYYYYYYYSGLWSRSRDVHRLVSVSSREKLSTSRSRLGHLCLVPKTNFRSNCAGHINTTSRFWALWECLTAASAGAFCIHSHWVSKSSADRYTLLTIVTIAHHINTLKTMNVKDNIYACYCN